MNKIILSTEKKPYINLAFEEFLFDNFKGDILYLWANADSVILGRNQNAYAECDTRKMAEDGVFLVRRTTGGGAVFHDRGNLNFTFIASGKNYDENKQFSVILNALKAFGLNATLTGRNDVEIGGKKISGNAFRHDKKNDRHMHHGTLLIELNVEKMGVYLTCSPLKIKAKGVKSVNARIANLKALNPKITVESLRAELIKSYKSIYGDCEIINASEVDKNLYQDKIIFFSSSNWIKNFNPQCEFSFSVRTSFGEFNFNFDVYKGKIKNIKVFSDSLTPTLPSLVASVLENTPLDIEELKKALSNLNDELFAEEILASLVKNLVL